ncbi:MAG: hypothetical protein WCJ35_18490 [Planctomycetota bacterium]
MSSTFRHRNGETNPVAVLCDSATPIEIGDLLYLDPVSSKAKPASAMADQATATLNQDAFQQFFLGVALQKNGLQSGETVPLNSTLTHVPANVIEVATTGDFEFDCASATWILGALVGACEKASGTALENQKVVTAASASLVIGKAVPEPNAIGNARTSVIVRIRSTILDGGIQNQVTGSSSGAV